MKINHDGLGHETRIKTLTHSFYMYVEQYDFMKSAHARFN